MTPELSPDEDDPPERSRRQTPEQVQDRQDRLAAEAKQLASSIASGDLTTLKTRVAWLLHEYPHTRDSDVALTLKYWELYQPMIYKPAGMMPKDLFRLERFTHITRVRAKIQNEYNLFPASEGVKRRRKKIEEDVKEEVLEDRAGRRLIYVFADETGKTQDFVCVAAVWAMTGRSVFEVSDALWKWRAASKFARRELHFTELKKNDIEDISDYLNVVLSKRELLSFKAISLERATTRRSIDEVVHRLHEFMIVRGVDHEIQRGRINLPHEVALTVDAEQSLDGIACADIRDRIAAAFKAQYDDRMQVAEVCAADSHTSEMLQLADLVAGAVNRRKNHKGDRGFKDEIADMVIERLSLQLEAGEISGLDATAWLNV